MYSIDSECAIREAKDNNLDVVFPKPNELQIDIDSEEAYARYGGVLERLQRHFRFITESITPSRSGYPKRHIVLTLREPVTDVQRIALQAILGSDPVRELLSLKRIENGDPHPTLFLEKKKA